MKNIALTNSSVRIRTAGVLLVERKYPMTLTNENEESTQMPNLQPDPVYFSKALWFEKRDLNLVPLATYLTLRPTCDIPNHTMMACITACQGNELSIGQATSPPILAAYFRKFVDAFEAALLIQQQNPHLHILYDGFETTAQMSGRRHLATQLAWTECDDEWDYYYKAMENLPLLANISSDVPDVICAVIGRALAEKFSSTNSFNKNP
ncbi:hypothetical protein FNL56_06150 [Tardiphaga sp. vice304]|uniref:hypothetical protein n=1 Tax=Tardiphaga sp. vice304 TaxID=2592817 RepID=UPI001164E573|nr:hypothetical protein [Tardiphaga sp. vice304]QDM25734.1 hypothetical protein FNL56_06150 [Tardiphaga sp. vice304]